MAIINPAELDLREESVVKIRRVAKVNARGKRFRFSAMAVVGDGKGHVGIGIGKAGEVITSINKAKEKAKQSIFKVPVINGTIPHKIIGRYGASKVLLKPASQGTGIIAGAPVRMVMEQVGVNDILTKCLGSNNSMNVVKATINALENLHDAVSVANRRGITITEIFK
ncbi:MAG: 30S ribosomal protein S5 [Candidatus Neomarinimicrobiota bacterium]